jgi:hypothetical protein
MHEPLQLSIVPMQDDEELPPIGVVPPALPLPLAPLPEPPVATSLPAVPLPARPSPEPPLFKDPSVVGVDENDPQEATMAPSDTTADTEARVRIFFMATSPIVKAT